MRIDVCPAVLRAYHIQEMNFFNFNSCKQIPIL